MLLKDSISPHLGQHGPEWFWRRALVAVDAVAIVAAMGLAFLLHGWCRHWIPGLRAFVPFEQYAAIAGIALPLWLGLDVALGLHRALESGWTRSGLAKELLKLNVAGLLGLGLLMYLTRSIVNRSAVLAFVVSAFTLMLGSRLVLLRWRRFQHRRGESEWRLLLVGDAGPELSAWAANLAGYAFPPRVLGRLGAPGDLEQVEYLGPLDALAQVFRRTAVDQVLFFPPHNRPESVLDSLALCESHGIPASFEISLAQPSLAAPKIVATYGRPFISFELAPRRPEALALKHALDVVLAGLAVLTMFPLLAAVAIAILVSSGRPILFAQERAGRNGRRFKMLKFRTMATAAESEKRALKAASGQKAPTFKLHGDPRITPIGRHLRRWSLDELPQLFNVLSGSMSLVGPRPLPVEEHEEIAGWHRRRLAMKPGLTGLWQVSGRSELAYEDWMRLDVKYVDEWSLGLDLELLLRTIPAVLSGRGAY